MVLQNTYIHFLYRQLFLTPSPVTTKDRFLIGQTAIVTGSNTGLGYHASVQLLSLGLSRLILAVRDPAKGEAAKQSLLMSLSVHHDKQPTIEVWPLDMTDYASITAFVDRVRDTPGLTVNLTILNAGVFRLEFEEKALGNEVTMATN